MGRFRACGSLFWSLSLGAMLAISCAAGEISVSQALERTEIPYHSTTTLTITISWQGAQSAYRFDRPLQPQLDKLKVREFSSTISSTGNAQDEITTKTFRYTLVPTGSGQGRIEPITIPYASWPDSVPGELVTEGMWVTIGAPPPVVKKTGWKERLTLPVLAVLGILVTAGTGAVFYVRARNKRPREVAKSPVELFLEQLTAAKAESGGDLKRFQTLLYRNLLWYVRVQHGIELSGLTMEKILRVVDSSLVPDQQKDRICGWLLRADREKFSPVMPAPGETIRLEAEVRQFFETLTLLR